MVGGSGARVVCGRGAARYSHTWTFGAYIAAQGVPKPSIVARCGLAPGHRRRHLRSLKQQSRPHPVLGNGTRTRTRHTAASLGIARLPPKSTCDNDEHRGSGADSARKPAGPMPLPAATSNNTASTQARATNPRPPSSTRLHHECNQQPTFGETVDRSRPLPPTTTGEVREVDA